MAKFDENTPVRKFRLLNGKHIEGSTTYRFKEGVDTIVESGNDLAAAYPDRFEEYDGPPNPKSAKAKGGKKVKVKPSGKGTEEDDEREIEADLGEEVTEEFKAAKKKELRVFHGKQGYNIVAKEDDETVLAGALRAKPQVVKFINEYDPDAE